MKEEIKNAIIEATSLGIEGHGIPTLSLTFDFGEGGHQAAGGYSLGGKYMCQQVTGILKTLEKENWEDLVGTSCRVKIVDRRIVSIGHYLKDVWHDFKPK